jgi:hypothetical protein
VSGTAQVLFFNHLPPTFAIGLVRLNALFAGINGCSHMRDRDEPLGSYCGRHRKACLRRPVLCHAARTDVLHQPSSRAIYLDNLLKHCNIVIVQSTFRVNDGAGDEWFARLI